LGWDDGTFLTFEVKSMAYDCYAKCEKVPPSLNAPTLPNYFPTPINIVVTLALGSRPKQGLTRV